MITTNRFVMIGSTGKFIELGHLENNPSQIVRKNSEQMYGFNQIAFSRNNLPLPPCSEIPDFSAIIGPLKTTTGSQPVVSGTRLAATCPGISEIGTSSNPVSYSVKIGNTGKNQPTTKATPTPSTDTAKPERPTFSLVNFTGNKVNINVDLGSGANKPDQIYLISPKIGATEA